MGKRVCVRCGRELLRWAKKFCPECAEKAIIAGRKERGREYYQKKKKAILATGRVLKERKRKAPQADNGISKADFDMLQGLKLTYDFKRRGWVWHFRGLENGYFKTIFQAKCDAVKAWR